MLHLRLSIFAPQPFPPCFMLTMTLRLRLCEPVLQEREHADHTLKPLTSQSTAHANALHERCSSLDGHTLPPYNALLTVLRRNWMPPPQVFEHDDHEPNMLTTQSTGHECLLHLRVRTSAGQA